ncbi:MAG TPA: CopG family transcriptional regulator [Egibacteraceae bacterium]|nr:CopG family transcriptional regulator [Egibacteraceae bacterium]
MVRKQLYIDEAHEAELKRRAAESGLTEAEIVRQALDQHLTGAAHGARGQGRGRMAAAADLDAHADDLVEKLTSRAVASSEPDREWTRDELYDDREHPRRCAVTLVVFDTIVIVYRYDARDDAKRGTAASTSTRRERRRGTDVATTTAAPR